MFSLSEIETVIEGAKLVIPAAEAAWKAVVAQIPQDKADAKAAGEAILKCFSDLKGFVPVVEQAVKAAVSAGK